MFWFVLQWRASAGEGRTKIGQPDIKYCVLYSFVEKNILNWFIWENYMVAHTVLGPNEKIFGHNMLFE